MLHKSGEMDVKGGITISLSKMELVLFDEIICYV